MKKEATHGITPGLEALSAPGPLKADGQHSSYWVLSEEDRAKGFVRPVRSSYMHDACGFVTQMSLSISETYARDPAFYGSTYCVGCKDHLPVGEFVWCDGSGDRVGS